MLGILGTFLGPSPKRKVEEAGTLRSSLPSHFLPSRELAPPGSWYWRDRILGDVHRSSSVIHWIHRQHLWLFMVICIVNGGVNVKRWPVWWRSPHPFPLSATSSRRVRATTLFQYLGPGWAHPGEGQIISKCWLFYKFTHDKERDRKYKLYLWPRTLLWAPDSNCPMFPLEDFRHVWN